jgi:acyl carrier protein
MALTDSEVMSRLQNIFDDVFLEKVEVRPDLTAKQVSEWDSLVHINLVAAVEENFGIRFRVGEVEATRNVGDFADLILKRSNGRV